MIKRTFKTFMRIAAAVVMILGVFLIVGSAGSADFRPDISFNILVLNVIKGALCIIAGFFMYVLFTEERKNNNVTNRRKNR